MNLPALHQFVRLADEHHESLSRWSEWGANDVSLVYFDAHLDLQWISPERLGRLAMAETFDDIKRLAQPHHLFPSNLHTHGIENFLFAAHRLGMVRDVIWVAPPHVDVSFSLSTLVELQQLEGVTFEELSNAKRTSGAISGTVLGVPLTVCSYQDLRSIPLPQDAWVDIDADFFVKVPSDKGWLSPRDFLGNLRELKFSLDRVTVCRSVSSGFLPLRYHFLADHLVALLTGNDKEANYYDFLYQANRLFDSKSEAAGCDHQEQIAAICGSFANKSACAAHLMSLVEPHNGWQEIAQSISSDFAFDTLRELCGISNRMLRVTPAILEGLSEAIWSMPVGQQKALSHAAAALVHSRQSNNSLEVALRHYNACADHFGCHPEVAFELGRRLAEEGNVSAAIEFLSIAKDGDTTAVSARFLLGQLLFQSGHAAEALPHLLEAHQRAPAWGMVTNLLAIVCRRLGDHHKSETLQRQVEEERAALRRLVVS